MGVRDNVAIQLLVRDEGMTWEQSSKMWETWKEAAKNGVHFGDCTGEPNTCMVCLVTNWYSDVDTIIAICKNQLSGCCHAPANVGGDDKEGTHYYVCTECDEPCDVIY